MNLYAAENLQHDLFKNHDIHLSENFLLGLIDCQDYKNTNDFIPKLQNLLASFAPQSSSSSKPQKLLLQLKNWYHQPLRPPLPGTDERGNFNCQVSKERNEYFVQYMSSFEKNVEEIWTRAPSHLFTAYRIKKIQSQLLEKK